MMINVISLNFKGTFIELSVNHGKKKKDILKNQPMRYT